MTSSLKNVIQKDWVKRAAMQAIKNAPREVIAHFTKGYITLIWFIALGLFATYALWARSVFLDGPADGALALAGHAVDLWGLVVLGGGLAFMLAGLCAVTFYTIINRGAALWIERGRLVYVYRRVLDVPLAEVAFVEIAPVPVYYGVLRTAHRNFLMVRLKSGKDVRLPMRYLEDTDEVIAQLRRRIGLPVA